MTNPIDNPDKLIGKKLGQFEIVKEIGRGGMATVYSARQLSMNRIVAVKVLPPHLLHDPTFYERFEREVDVIAHLEHPHILPIYDYGQAEGVPYIAMRYLGGGSFDQTIRRGPPGPDDIAKPLEQIAEALDYAHRQGIIHRDLKPANIMLDENGNAYLSDFGIARVLGSNMTGSMIVGTPAYMSPEQANGLPIDARADIYALGVVIFEALTGREPFQAETPMAILLKHINEPLPPMATYREDVPPAVEDVIQKATAKDPDARFASAGETIATYRAALRGDVASTRAAQTRNNPAANRMEDKATEVVSPATQNAVTSSQDTALETPRRSNNLLLALVAVLVLAVVAVGAVLVVSSQSGNDGDIAAIPTAFPRASVINEAAYPYSVTIPNNWIPPSVFRDLTNDVGNGTFDVLHEWEEPGRVYVRLGLIETTSTADAVLNANINSYTNRFLPEDADLIEEVTAEDGTLRRSYRVFTGNLSVVVGENTEPDQNNSARGLPPGQLDVFYRIEGGYFVVIEMYTADTTGSALVEQLQLVLNSVRINPERTS